MPGQFDVRAQRRVDPRQALGGQAHRDRRPVFKPVENLLLYASYSRGYKAGGFNLDRSALKSPTVSFASLGGAQALVGNLQFDPETVDAFELGGKFSRRGILLNVAVFRQQFKNFQLNTFDGSVFIVQNINGCSSSLNGLDRDQSFNPGSPNFIPPVIAAGSAFNINPAASTAPARVRTSATASARPVSSSRAPSSRCAI